MSTLADLCVFSGAMLWLPSLIRLLWERPPDTWLLAPGTLRAALVLLIALCIGGWPVILGEGAMCLALGAWLISGELAVYLATHLMLRSQILATLATAGSTQSPWWRYLQLALLSILVARGDAARTAHGAGGEPSAQISAEACQPDRGRGGP